MSNNGGVVKMKNATRFWIKQKSMLNIVRWWRDGGRGRATQSLI